MLFTFEYAHIEPFGAIVAHCRTTPKKVQLTFYMIENEEPLLLRRNTSGASYNWSQPFGHQVTWLEAYPDHSSDHPDPGDPGDPGARAQESTS